MLHPGKERIIDLSLKCGYESPDAFSKAFAAQFGVTPSAYRRNPVPLKPFPPLYFRLMRLEGMGGTFDYYKSWPSRHIKGGKEMSVLSGFTDKERDKCLPVVNQIVELANIARQKGVLALEEWAGKHDNTFVSFLLMLVCDGTDPQLVKSIGETLIESGGFKGEELLSRLMTVEGLLSVQAGENPRLIETKLYAMLGEKYMMAKGLFSTDGKPYLPGFGKLADALAAQEGLPQSAAFNETFAAMGDRNIQMVLRETDRNDLSVALKGCIGLVGMKFLANMSKRLGAMVLEEMEYMGPMQTTDVLAAQEKLLAIVNRLRESGEID
jgi:hypothetical protein